MANDFDCSIDYLVNEAMRYYARSKNYQSPGGGQGQMTGGQPSPGTNNSSGAQPNNFPAPPPSTKPPSIRSQPATQQPPPQPAMGGGAGATGAGNNSVRRPAPPTPGYAARGNAGSAPPSGARGDLQQHAPAPATQSPPGGGFPPQMGAAGPTLFLLYNGQRYPVTKDQFIIGRGSKTSDLAIKDGNISRKHAAVIRRNGTFYIKDLGSTNGIDYKGMRIDNKRIDEGDIFHICDYELRFTYR
jgi:pSer/pThr/pTyr-binding forkhead associated (FHA) protein